MWKDRMKKQHSQCFKNTANRTTNPYLLISIRIFFSAGAVPKNYGNACSNVSDANRALKHTKAKSRDNSILNRTISRHTVLDNLTDKIHQSTNPDREQIETCRNTKEAPADCLKSTNKCLNELATFVGNKHFLCAEANTEAR
jgi:hypothetical protein